MDDEKEKRVSIKYTRSNDFRMVSATGAYGGINPQAEVICNFYVESRKYPETMKLIIDGETDQFREERDEEEDVYIRELQFGVVMRPDIARVVGEWLIKESEKAVHNVDSFETQEKEEEDKK